MSDLFLTAIKDKYRFNTIRGLLTVENLWELPLSTKSNNAVSLDTVAISINNELKSIETESFVKESNSAVQQVLTNKLEIVKFIIKDKQDKLEAEKAKLEKSEKISKLKDALAKKEDETIQSLSPEEILKQLKDLEG